MPNFIVSGRIKGVGDTSRYYAANSEGQVQKIVLEEDFDRGGFIKFSIKQVENFPEDAFIECPECAHSFLDDNKVVKLK